MLCENPEGRCWTELLTRVALLNRRSKQGDNFVSPDLKGPRTFDIAALRPVYDFPRDQSR